MELTHTAITGFVLSIAVLFGANCQAADTNAKLATKVPVKPAFSLPLDGVVDKLWISPSRTHLFLTVRPDGRPEASKQYGLYVFSLADPQRPRRVAYIPIRSPYGLALSRDGRFAYVMNTWFQGYPRDEPYGLMTIDVAVPDTPRLVGLLARDIMVMHLSQDGQHVFLQERNFPPKTTPSETLVLRIGAGSTNDRLCTISHRRSIDREPIFAYGFATFPDNARLAVREQAGTLYIFDASDPCKARLEREFREEGAGGVSLQGGRDNKLFVGGNGISIFDVSGEPKKVAEFFFTGVVSHYNVDEVTGTITAAVAQKVLVLKVRADGAFEVCEQYEMPRYLIDAITWDEKTLYVGLSGSLAIVERRSNLQCALTTRR